ncbi:MAG: nucleotidyltransferase family protein [Sphingomonadaceae bacterium]
MNAARLLVGALRDPGSVYRLDGGWTTLIVAARAEALLASLAYRLEAMELPARVAAILADARRDSEVVRRQALWEAEMARRALAAHAIPLILLKGTAYLAAGLDAGTGRQIGDLDILVARKRLGDAERALLAAGWEWVKPDPYDDRYYRRWMHELPPLIHKQRDRMIDVHHTIMPLTAGPTPDAERMIADSVALGGGPCVLAPADMVVHAAAHLFADGDLSGGLRNLWDIDRLLREFGGADFWPALAERARLHGRAPAVARALRLARRLYHTPVDEALAGRAHASDRLFEARLLARDGWGRQARPLLRFGFYVRSHLLRMPPAMLARHLWTKWRGKPDRRPVAAPAREAG